MEVKKPSVKNALLMSGKPLGPFKGFIVLSMPGITYQVLRKGSRLQLALGTSSQTEVQE